MKLSSRYNTPTPRLSLRLLFAEKSEKADSTVKKLFFLGPVKGGEGRFFVPGGGLCSIAIFHPSSVQKRLLFVFFFAKNILKKINASYIVNFWRLVADVGSALLILHAD